MVSNTSSSLGNVTHPSYPSVPATAYQAFDGYDSTYVYINSTTAYVGYEFNKPMEIESIDVTVASAQSDNKRLWLYVAYEGSSSYVSVSDVICTPSKQRLVFDFDTTNKIKAFYVGCGDGYYNIYDICVIGCI